MSNKYPYETIKEELSVKNMRFKKIITAVLAAAMLMSSNGFTIRAIAADKIYVDQVYAKTYKETMAIGTTKQLSVFVEPKNASNKKVTYSTSNRKVATVSSGGLVTAISSGTATITIRATDGSGQTDTVIIQVLKDLTITGKHVDADNEIIILDKTYGNITVDSSVKDAVIYLSGVTVRNMLTLESGDYTLNLYDSTANKVVFDEPKDEIISLALGEEDAKAPKLNVGSNTAISEIWAKVNAMIKQEDGSQIDGLRFEQSKEGKIIIYLEDYSGKLLLDSSFGDLEVVATGCSIAEVLVTGGEKAGNVQLTNGGDSTIEAVDLIGNANLELAIPTTRVTMDRNASGASLTVRDSVGTIRNEGTGSFIKVSGSVDQIESVGQKAEITVDAPGYIGTLNMQGAASSLAGAGEVSEAYINANDCRIDTTNTLVMVGEKVLNAKIMGVAAAPGTSVTSQPPTPVIPFIPPALPPEIPEDPSIERYFTSFYLPEASAFSLGDSTFDWDPDNTTITKDFYLNGTNFKNAAAGAGITDPDLLNKFTTWAGVKEVVRGFEFTVTVNTGKSKDAATNLQADLIIQNEKALSSYNGSFKVISQNLGVKELSAGSQPISFRRQFILDEITGWDPADMYMVKAAIRFTNTDEAVPVTGTVTVKVLSKPKSTSTPTPTPTPTGHTLFSAGFEDGASYGLTGTIGTGLSFANKGASDSAKSILVDPAAAGWGNPGYELFSHHGKKITVIASVMHEESGSKDIKVTMNTDSYPQTSVAAASGVWTKIAMEFPVIPEDASYPRIYFEPGASAPAAFYLDNVLVYEGTMAQAEAAYATLFPTVTVTTLTDPTSPTYGLDIYADAITGTGLTVDSYANVVEISGSVLDSMDWKVAGIGIPAAAVGKTITVTASVKRSTGGSNAWQMNSSDYPAVAGGWGKPADTWETVTGSMVVPEGASMIFIGKDDSTKDTTYYIANVVITYQ